jgi:Na+-driven multidrug efflux pump
MHKIQDEDKQSKKHNAICVGQHYAQTKTNNVNKYAWYVSLFCTGFISFGYIFISVGDTIIKSGGFGSH